MSFALLAIECRIVFGYVGAYLNFAKEPISWGVVNVA